jgi:arylsulfatase A-like enzyme
VHYFDPHDPVLLPPKRIKDRFARDLPPSHEWKRSMYDAEVFFMDQEIGRLFRYLKDSGLYENTVIVVVGDHGEGLGDHDWWHHRVLYQEQIRLPMILRLPGGPERARVGRLVRSIDLFPTVLEWLDLPVPEGVEGRSLVKLMNGERDPPRFAYADAINLLDNNLGAGIDERHRDLMYCVTDGAWKLIYRQFNPDRSELYHLAEDPLEIHNVIDRYPDQRKRLMTLFEQTGGRIDQLIEAAPENKELLEKLKALGYGF